MDLNDDLLLEVEENDQLKCMKHQHDDESEDSLRENKSIRRFHDTQKDSEEKCFFGADLLSGDRASAFSTFLGRLLEIMHKNLIPDHQGVFVRGFLLVEGEFTVKLIKFLLLTFTLIALVHMVVEHYFTDRDLTLSMFDILRYEGNLIVMDSIVFFLVGRLWRQRGVDYLAWVLPVIVCNIYFESQNFIPWLQHSATLYDIHCLWPWKLWLFVIILVPTITALVLVHLKRAWTERLLLMKLMEISMVFSFFVAPVITSDYLHLHHWFAGWLLGMHCNFDVWWSRMAMAYCWGMYINGIAVYGRDPVLSCDYAYFLSIDNECPYTKCYLDALEDMEEHPGNATHVVDQMEPVDWRNCSASGYVMR